MTWHDTVFGIPFHILYYASPITTLTNEKRKKGIERDRAKEGSHTFILK